MEQLLTELSKRGVKVRVEDGKLHVTAREGELSDDVQQALRQHKAQLLEHFRSRNKDTRIPVAARDRKPGRGWPLMDEPAVEFEPNPVSSHNEWDPLEEVIVGRVTGAALARMHVAVRGAAPKAAWPLLEAAGFAYPAEQIDAANGQLESLIQILRQAGVTVRRPAEFDYARPFSSPDWSSEVGFCSANPRDVLLVVGDELIEATMSWRSRYFEIFAYRELIKQYFRHGARWTAAPKPELLDELYVSSYMPPEPGEPLHFVTTEWEPIFDAADFARCGTDIFVQRSNTTNQMGIEWMRRHLGEPYRIHELPILSRQPMHLDTTFVPLAPGRVLVNPTYLDCSKLPEICKNWEMLQCPPMVADPSDRWGQSLSSVYLGMNVLSIDERRVVVEEQQKPLMAKLREWGFEPVPCPFTRYSNFGGGFHCATADIRRRGTLRSYA